MNLDLDRAHSTFYSRLIDACREQLDDDARRMLLRRLFIKTDDQFDNVELVNGETLEC